MLRRKTPLRKNPVGDGLATAALCAGILMLGGLAILFVIAAAHLPANGD